MIKPADIVRGNDFILNAHVSVWDENFDSYVSYDMTGARNISAWLVRDRLMSERLPIPGANASGGTVTMYVPGRRLRLGTYGLEISWVAPDGKAKRVYRRGLLNILNCNDEPTSEPREDYPVVTDVNIYINVDVESVDIGLDTVPVELLKQVKANTRKLEGIDEGAEKNVQSDWVQNDPSKDDYIRNRTHWTESGSFPATLEWVWDGEDEKSLVFYLKAGDTSIAMRYTGPDSWESDGGIWGVYWDGHRLDLFDSALRTAYHLDGFAPGVTEMPIDLGFSLDGAVVHKLESKYLDTDDAPTRGSAKPITSDAVAVALEDVAFIGDEIGIAPPPGVDFNAYSDTVWNKRQTLSQAQKDQVKENLGITTDENLSNLEIIDLLGF